MSRRAGVTIEDVAAAVGVSRQTVSRVLNRGPNVKASVRERVLAAIEVLGYVPNLSARRMGGGRSFLILAINDRARTIDNWRAGRGNDWVDQMLHGGMTECERHGYHLVFELVETGPTQALRQLSQAIASLRPDGVILTPPHGDNASLVTLLGEQKVACARIGHREGGALVDVYMDEEGAAHAATTTLLQLGHLRLLFLAGSPSYAGSAQRIAGFERALSDAGPSVATGRVEHGDFQFGAAAHVLDRCLSGPERPTAIIADNDEMAFAALHVANSHGLGVPADLSVISFEDTPGVRFSVPPLTAVRQPISAMIGTACAQLIAIVRGDAKGGAHEIPYELVLRASTGPAPAPA